MVVVDSIGVKLPASSPRELYRRRTADLQPVVVVVVVVVVVMVICDDISNYIYTITLHQ